MLIAECLFRLKGKSPLLLLEELARNCRAVLNYSGTKLTHQRLGIACYVLIKLPSPCLKGTKYLLALIKRLLINRLW